MITLNCPSCGAEVKFVSKASVFAVCSFCQSTLVRQDMNLESIGKMAQLQDEMSPIQIGTAGMYDGKQFDVIGRLKVTYSDGNWNEWFTIFPDGRTGWLAEAQGFFAMCFPVGNGGHSLSDKNFSPPNRDQIRAGAYVDLPPHGEFMVDDIHDVVCKFAEGELPMQAAKGRKSTSVDLRGPEDEMATIEYADDCVRVFVGKYQDFDEFKFKHLREIDGW